MRFAITFFGVVMLCIIAFVHDAPANDHASMGLKVTSSPSHITFTLRPVVHGWDTVDTDQGQRLLPDIAGARPRQDVQTGVIQWVVPFDVIVPHAKGFALNISAASALPLSLQLQPGLTPEGIPIPTQPPLTAVADMRYTGIGRGRHYATVSIVVAETRNGITTLLSNIEGKIDLAPSSSIAHTSFDQRHADMSVTAVNPDAPWIAPSHRPTFNKIGESIQDLTVSNAFIIEIPTEGIYRISADQLRGLGIPTDASAASTIKIFGLGGGEIPERVEPPVNNDLLEQDIIVRTNSDGSISDVVFYAGGPVGWRNTPSGVRHYINHFDTKAGYLLTYGGQQGRRSTIRPAVEGPVDHSPLTTRGYVFNEEEITSPYNSGSGRKWWGRPIANDGSLIVSTPLPGLVRNGQVTYRTNVAHNGTTSGTVVFIENGTAIGNIVLPSIPQYMDTYSATMTGVFDASSIASDGKSMLRYTYNSADNTANGYLDWFEIAYPRGLVADDREFSFFTDPGLVGVYEYTVNGFEGGDVFAFDVTDAARPQRIANVAPSGGLFGIRDSVGEGQVKRYFISSKLRTAGLRNAGTLTLRQRASEGMMGDLLVITHPALKESALRFADYRRENSDLVVTVITTNEIYDEFGYGVKDPTSVRDFIGFVYRNSPHTPRYVLFWGDGHFDYKNISSSQPNYVLPYESLDPDDSTWGLYTYTADEFFVRVEGNDARPEMAIGRLPLSSNENGDMLIDKISRYESEAARDDWRTKITLIADDGTTSNNDSDGSLYLTQSETLEKSYISKAFQHKKVYLVEYPTENVAKGRRKPAVTADYLSTINTSGTLLLNWIGHGNPRVWAHEFIFERETTPYQMTNATKPFFLTAATCDFARFDMVDLQSGAEELLMLDYGGAIGVFSASRVVFAYSNEKLAQEFYRQQFKKEANGTFPRLGDVMFRLRQNFSGDNDEKFFLMADPSMKLLIPDHNVEFETINGVELGTETIQIKALSTVTVTGHITTPIGDRLDESFNGTVTVSLLDAERHVTVFDTDKFQTENNFTLPGAALSRGSYKVESGRFTATFVVPKDIAFSSENARLYGYAISSDDRTAMGVTDELIVNEVSSESHDDDQGPLIKIFMDSRLFAAGEVVRDEPILIVDLSDDTGINTTGIGVGHGIVATFDGGALVEDITETFATSLEDSRSGTATKQIFSLVPGLHTVRVRAWDVLNNMSEAETTFRIATDDEGIVGSWSTNYPNPFSSTTTIRIKHNTSAPFTADVAIYDVQGRLVYDADMAVQDMQTAELEWDGRSSEGTSLPTGVYVAMIHVKEINGDTSIIRGKLALIR